MNAVGRKVVKDLVQKYHPHIFIIMEPHCQFSQVCIFWDKLGFAPMAVSEANGHLGGIWVLGVNGVSFSMIDYFPQVISLEVGVPLSMACSLLLAVKLFRITYVI